jgi:hypothetical protein
MPSQMTRKKYGTVSADRQKEMSGLEFVQGLVGGTLPLNTIAETLGYDVTEAVIGRVVVTQHGMALILIPPAPCTVVSPPRCSTAAWASPSSQSWRRVSVRRRSNSRFHSYDQSRRKQVSSRQRASF